MENKSSSPSSAQSSETSASELPAHRAEPRPWQNFLVGFTAGALLSFVGLSISMDMTYTAIAGVSFLSWIAAIALPFVLGTLSAAFKEPFLATLDAAMRSLPY